MESSSRQLPGNQLIFFRTIVENATDAVSISDFSGNMWYWNSAFLELFGKKDPESFPELFRGSVSNGDILQKTLQEEDWTGEVQMTGKDGATLNILLRTQTVRDGQDVIGLAWVFKNLAERDQIRKELQESEYNYRALVENSPDLLYRTNLDGVITFISASVENLSGYTIEEATGLKMAEEVYAYPEERQNFLETLRKNSKVKNFQARLKRKDGSIWWAATNAHFLKDEMGNVTGVEGITRDISELKEAEDTRKTYEAQLEQAQKIESIGTLAGGIAHDFNNLIGGLFGYLNLALNKVDNPKVQGYISKALQASERAAGLTQQLLTFSKGGSPIKQVEPLGPFLRETTQFALSGSNVSCSFDIDKGLWTCNFDRNQIRQAIDNIVLNAQDAMPKGGEISIKAKNVEITDNTIAGLEPGYYVRISIADTGTGIPEDNITRIFDPFFTTKQTGSGLGLTTAYSIIKKHGGMINVDSRPGKGSTFHISVPAAEKPAYAEQPKKTEFFEGSGCILVMDDDELLQMMLSEMLEDMGYTTVLAAEGQQALDAFRLSLEKNTPFKAVILDLTIRGGMGGKETISKIRELDTEIPVFVSSGYSGDDVIANPESYGFTGSIIKPFGIDQLVKVFKEYSL